MARNVPATEPSERQLEVVRMFADGKECKEIAHALGIGVETVCFHLLRFMRVTGVPTRAHIIHWAIRKGLVQLRDFR